MIISHKHKFIFIKTHKTAGTSLEIALSGICGEKDIISPISEVDEAYRLELGFKGKQNYYVPISKYKFTDFKDALENKRRVFYYNHISAKEIKARLSPKIWNTYYKFCFDRNPYDKFISWYYWRGGQNRFPTFKHFIDSGVANKVKGFDLYTINSVPVVDKVYKFEELSTAMLDISKKLNLTETLQLPPKKTKGTQRKNKSHYSEILDEFEKNWIARTFEKEIDFLDYKF